MNGLPFLQHLIIVPVLLPMLVGALLIPVNQNRHQLKFACSLASAVLLWLLSVALLRLADAAGLRPVAEGFADRGYLPDGGLVPRSDPRALVRDPAEVARRVIRMAAEREAVAVDGSVVRLDVESVCLHGDTDGAVALAVAVRAALADARIDVAAFAP